MDFEFDYREELEDYFPEFIEALGKRLSEDKRRWGDTWKHRSFEGQDDRMYDDMMRYLDQYKHGKQEMPYLKIIGNAFIHWVREYEKELTEKTEED